MDKDGWIPASLIATFPRLQNYTSEVEAIREVSCLLQRFYFQKSCKTVAIHMKTKTMVLVQWNAFCS